MNAEGRTQNALTQGSGQDGSVFTMAPVTCAWCNQQMGYVHGHAACLDGGCPMFGVNQAECCGGETAETCPTPTSVVTQRTQHP